jgi:hypothetical protein
MKNARRLSPAREGIFRVRLRFLVALAVTAASGALASHAAGAVCAGAGGGSHSGRQRKAAKKNHKGCSQLFHEICQSKFSIRYLRAGRLSRRVGDSTLIVAVEREAGPAGPSRRPPCKAAGPDRAEGRAASQPAPRSGTDGPAPQGSRSRRNDRSGSRGHSPHPPRTNSSCAVARSRPTRGRPARAPR